MRISEWYLYKSKTEVFYCIGRLCFRIMLWLSALTANNQLWFPLIIVFTSKSTVSQLVKKFPYIFQPSIFIFPSQQHISTPVQYTNSPSVKPFPARRIEINTIHIIFSVRHSSVLLCFVKQPSFVLKAIVCNFLPHITVFPSAIFPLQQSDIPEYIFYTVVTYTYVSFSKSGQKKYTTKRKHIL